MSHFDAPQDPKSFPNDLLNLSPSVAAFSIFSRHRPPTTHEHVQDEINSSVPASGRVRPAEFEARLPVLSQRLVNSIFVQSISSPR